MANTVIQVKRTSVASRRANTSTITTGELGLNITDGIMFSSNGSTIFEIGANVTNQSVTGNATISGGIIANGGLGTAGQVLYSNGTSIYWSNAASGGGASSRVYEAFTSANNQTIFTVTGGYTNNLIDVYYNGVHLANTEYTQNGTHIALDVAAVNGAVVEVSGFKTISAIGSLTTSSNTEVIFNDSNDLVGNSNFTYDKTTSSLSVANLSISAGISANGGLGTNGQILYTNSVGIYWADAPAGGGGDTSLDGGSASSTYTAPQSVDGGTASG